MCGRYGFSVKKIEDVYSRYGVTNKLDDYTPRFNISPGQMNPVITQSGQKKIQRMFWGLVPYWANDRSIAFKTINARAEDIDKKPSFKKPFASQRCLVPATGFYEWNKNIDPHIPYYFTIGDKEVFSFAGLFDIWIDPKNHEELFSYTIITTIPNELVKPIHHRMPVILKKEDEEMWITPEITSLRLLNLLKPYNASDMKSYPVSRNVNNIRIDNDSLIKPWEDYPEQKSLI